MEKSGKPEALDSLTRAHLEREIKFLLIPWFSFRAYIRFTGKDKKKGHFYGNEHQCTYNQCFYGKVPNIALRKAKGFLDLVNFIEKLKGKYVSAKIFMRNPGAKEFDVLCREYYRGEIVIHHEPVLSEDEVFLLYYNVEKGRLVIQEEEPKAEDKLENIDFREMISENLKPRLQQQPGPKS